MSSILESQPVRVRPAVLYRLLRSWQELHFCTTNGRLGPSGILGSICAVVGLTLKKTRMAPTTQINSRAFVITSILRLLEVIAFAGRSSRKFRQRLSAMGTVAAP